MLKVLAFSLFTLSILGFSNQLLAKESRFDNVFGDLTLRQIYYLCIDDVKSSDIETCINYGFSYETLETRFELNNNEWHISTEVISIFGEHYLEESTKPVCINCSNSRTSDLLSAEGLIDFMSLIAESGFETKRTMLNGKEVDEEPVKNTGELFNEQIWKLVSGKEPRDGITRALFSAIENSKARLITVTNKDKEVVYITRPDGEDLEMLANLRDGNKIINEAGQEGLSFSATLFIEEFSEYLALLESIFDEQRCSTTMEIETQSRKAKAETQCFPNAS